MWISRQRTYNSAQPRQWSSSSVPNLVHNVNNGILGLWSVSAGKDESHTRLLSCISVSANQTVALVEQVCMRSDLFRILVSPDASENRPTTVLASSPIVLCVHLESTSSPATPRKAAAQPYAAAIQFVGPRTRPSEERLGFSLRPGQEIRPSEERREIPCSHPIAASIWSNRRNRGTKQTSATREDVK